MQRMIDKINDYILISKIKQILKKYGDGSIYLRYLDKRGNK